jgi:hypothetical protein
VWVVGFIPGIIAICLGMAHRNQARANGENPSGMNTAGWICGLLGTIVSVLFWILILAAVHSANTGGY